MKISTFAAAVAVLTLSGCMQGPTTSGEVRQMAAAGSLFGNKSGVQVSRSYSAVVGSLRAGARKCLNRTQTTTSVTPGTYGPTTQRITTAYRTEVKAASSKTELAMYQEVLGSGLLPSPRVIPTWSMRSRQAAERN